MQKIHQNILIVLFSLFIIPIIFYLFEFVWDYFRLGVYTSENIFIIRSSCDPVEAEPTYFTIGLILLIGVLLAIFFIKFLFKYKLIK